MASTKRLRDVAPNITTRRANPDNCKRCGDPPGMKLCQKCVDHITHELVATYDPMYKRDGAHRGKK